jgi:hypothetical protein
MTGQELFEKYTDLNDQSTEKEREYSQTLFTILMLDADSLFALLVDAEKKSKKLAIKEPEAVPAGSDYELTITDVILV